MPYGDETSPDVLNDDDLSVRRLLEIDDTQRENTRTRGGRVINSLRTWRIMGISIFHLTLTELFAYFV